MYKVMNEKWCSLPNDKNTLRWQRTKAPFNQKLFFWDEVKITLLLSYTENSMTSCDLIASRICCPNNTSSSSDGLEFSCEGQSCIPRVREDDGWWLIIRLVLRHMFVGWSLRTGASPILFKVQVSDHFAVSTSSCGGIAAWQMNEWEHCLP